LIRLLFALLLSAPLLAADDEKAAGHSLHGEAFNEGPRQQAYLIPGMGNVTFAVTTKVPEAQQFFTQGVAQLHSFYYFESERSFRQAAALDPDLALAYWGMAMANVNNEKRAKEFLARAEKLKDKASPRERLWINFLAEWYKNASGDKRARASIKALETIVSDFPEEVEAKAFLAWACFHFNDKGLAISSHQAVDSIIADVLRANPMHPGAHHYRIHLWDAEKAARGTSSASLFGPSAPGIAHAWHMPGHIWTKLHRYGDAAQQQEASARVDHAQMIRDRTMPYQIHNYVHNNQWCMQDLMYVGRVRDAIAIGENLIEIPRHPKLNKIEDGGQASREGRSRLFEVLVKWELWDELLARSATYLAPSGNDDDEVKRLRAVGAASFAKNDREAGERCIAALEALEKKARPAPEAKKDEAKKDEAKKEEAKKEEPKPEEPAKTEPKKEEPKKDDKKKGGGGKLKPIENALAELRGLAEEDPKKALDLFGKCDDLRKEVLAHAQLRAGEKEKAEKTAKQAADGADGQAIPLACYAEILLELGKQKEAGDAWKKLAPIVRHADKNLPVLNRLEALAAQVKVDLPADKTAVPQIEKLGPLAWSPPPAPGVVLPDADGAMISVKPLSHTPVLLIFYLGSKCAHCVQQLGKFASVAADFQKENIQVIAVSSETREQLSQQRAAKGSDPYPFTLLADPSLQTFKDFRCFDDFEKTPLHGTFLVDADKSGQARIRWQDISYDPFMDAPFLLAECKRLLSLK
jgi:peroxiredoxin